MNNITDKLKEALNNLDYINDGLDETLQIYLDDLPFLSLFVEEELKDFNPSNIYNKRDYNE